MTIEELTTIVQTADKKKVADEMKRIGYVLCNTNRKLGKVGIVELVNAIKQETEDYSDSEHKRLFNGRICNAVKGYENYKFVIVNVYEIKPSDDPFDDEETAIQTEMLIYAKEIK